MTGESKEVARAALLMALTKERQEESELKADFLRKSGIKTAAVDYGGEFISAIKGILERALVASRREGVISNVHAEEGAIAGATREALSQITLKAIGLNICGKIGVARKGDHVSVAIFVGVGLLHLDEVAIGLGHRAVL